MPVYATYRTLANNAA